MAQTNSIEKTIYNILNQREEFVVIGLTGRMGSGCTHVANLLATPFDKMNFPNPKPQAGMKSLSEEERTIRIIAEYAESHWLKFDVIQVGSILCSFVINNSQRFWDDIVAAYQKKRESQGSVLTSACATGDIQSQELIGRFKTELYQKVQKNIYEQVEAVLETLPPTEENISTSDTYKKIFLEKYKKLVGSLKSVPGIVEADHEMIALYAEKPIWEAKLDWDIVSDIMNSFYQRELDNRPEVHRRKYLEIIDQLLDLFSAHHLLEWIEQVKVIDTTKGAEETSQEDSQISDQEEIRIRESFWQELTKLSDQVYKDTGSDLADKQTAQITMDTGSDLTGKQTAQITKYIFVKYLTTWFGRFIKDWLTENIGQDVYARLFQRYGQLIRYYSEIPPLSTSAAGTCANPEENDENKGEQTGISKKDIFAIPRRINTHIKVLRHPFNSKKHRPVRVVVDSVKNIFEAVYLRYRYSAFYLWAITTDTPIREKRLRDKHLTDVQMRLMDWNEYPTQGCEVYLKAKKRREDCTDTEIKFLEDSLGDNSPLPEDNDYKKIREEFYEKKTFPFYMQDVESCIDHADVYIFNNVENDTDVLNKTKLQTDLVRNVSLVFYPCLVRPTQFERCMQIAFSAKVNSGCLSRQVGAVVTDAQYNILSIGWNDVPCGEVPCVYKNLEDISASLDVSAYSNYELHDAEFRRRLRRYTYSQDQKREILHGLPWSYCFKNEHQKNRDPMRSRAMHAEEKALALCGKEAEGGYLFTTSSPCEMCSKNAKNHKIKKIYYIEAYPGISRAQYTESGNVNNRAEQLLFSGAVGRAYMQMYTPLMPHKDVLEYLGIHKLRKEQD